MIWELILQFLPELCGIEADAAAAVRVNVSHSLH